MSERDLDDVIEILTDVVSRLQADPGVRLNFSDLELQLEILSKRRRQESESSDG